MPEKCKTCKIFAQMKKSNEPCCCIWFMDNILLGDKTIDDCTEYIDINSNEE